MNATGIQTELPLGWGPLPAKGCGIYGASAVDILWFWAEGLGFNSHPAGAVFWGEFLHILSFLNI